jgi:class 3 adenylate cyclase
MHPETRYARSGDTSIAYQTLGEGPFDLVFVPGMFSNVEYEWEDPAHAAFNRRLAAFSRLIIFDKRGTGLSDRVRDLPTLEERMDDVRAVMDAAGSARAAVVGASEGGPMAAVFAATYPERTFALVLYGATPRYTWAPDFPWGSTREDFEQRIAQVEGVFGSRGFCEEMLRRLAPTAAADERIRDYWTTFLRLSGSPGAAAALWRMNMEIDVRPVLPVIQVPTLILNRAGDEPEPARWMAEQIPGATYCELPGVDHLPWVGDSESVCHAIETFVTDAWKEREWEEAESERVLATVLFTDIVGSTARLVDLGDQGWREIVRAHHAIVRRQLLRFRGREIDTAGDGFFATFDGPARAIRCASAINEAVRELGIEVRAGLHTGECAVIDHKVGGVAVHVGARIAAEAQPGEVLVSSTVRDLVAGSGIEFEGRGAATLRGLPGTWRVFAVKSC